MFIATMRLNVNYMDLMKNKICTFHKLRDGNHGDSTDQKLNETSSG